MEKIPDTNTSDHLEGQEMIRVSDYDSFKVFAKNEVARFGEQDIYESIVYALEIGYIASADIPMLVEKGVDDEDPFVRLVAFTLAIYSEDDIVDADLVQKASTDTNVKVRIAGVNLISKLPESERSLYLMKGLEDEDDKVSFYASFEVNDIPQEEKVGVLRKMFSQDDDYIRGLAVEAVPGAPEKDRAEFIKLGLLDKSKRVNWRASSLLDIVSKKDLAEVIEIALENADEYTIEQIVEVIKLVPSREERMRLRTLNPNKSLAHKLWYN